MELLERTTDVGILHVAQPTRRSAAQLEPPADRDADDHRADATADHRVADPLRSGWCPASLHLFDQADDLRLVLGEPAEHHRIGEGLDRRSTGNGRHQGDLDRRALRQRPQASPMAAGEEDQVARGQVDRVLLVDAEPDLAGGHVEEAG